MIIPAIGTDFFRRQYDTVVQPAGCSPEQPFYYEDVNFGHSPPPNCKGLACLIDKIVQSNLVIMQSNKAV